jgi:signal transduction histidine kinase
MADTLLVDQLARLENLASIPRRELEWLVAHGQFEAHAAGSVVSPKGQHIDRLMIILKGRIGVYVDRGAGERRVMGWPCGEVTGMLPYSRMAAPPGNGRCEADTELLTVHEDQFHAMVSSCPRFTAYAVHLMLDRARHFSASDLQDEKMISLGRLAAGLAHELNNPASAATRSAMLLRTSLDAVDEASRALRASGASARLFDVLARAATTAAASEGGSLSAVARADLEDEVAAWLERHGADPAQAVAIVESGVTQAMLEELTEEATGDALGAALRWLTASCELRSLATTIERASGRIFDLVAAVKRFTFMDSLAGPEFTEVGQGLRDTLTILSSKIKAKGAVVALHVEDRLPRVRAAGGELNQVWLNLLDNALDAIAAFGHVTLTARRDHSRVIVSVVDDGPGIPPDVLPRIFDPFFTTKAPGHGTGLGLDIARRLVRRHQGEITAVSEPGRTEFEVTLQIAPPDSAA